MNHLPNDPVELYRARGLPEAHAIRVALEEEGIPVRIDNELLQGAVGELPMGWNTAPRIMVERSHAESALRILDGYLQQTAPSEETEYQSDRCLACGASMREFDVCPKCGWSFEPEAAENPDGDPESEVDES